MRLVVRRLAVADVGTLQSLVIDSLDGVEPGLRLLDSRLALGHSAVDVLAVDARARLVLLALGVVADDSMLLRALDAYAWCIEYPEALRRLYPSVDLSEERPPRVIFVVERAPGAFQRKLRQLAFSEADCVEVRHLDVGGEPAVYFDTILELRRHHGAPARADASTPALDGAGVAVAPPPGPARPAAVDNVIPIGPTAVLRPTALKLERSMHEGNGHVELPATAPEPAMVVAGTVPAASNGHAHLECVIAGAAPAGPRAAPTPDAPRAVAESPVGAPPADAAIAASVEAPAATVEAEPVATAAAIAPGAAPAVVSVKAATPADEARAVPAARVAAAPTPAGAAPAAPPANPLLAALNFPNDGQLTRQWMEFLNQMAASK